MGGTLSLHRGFTIANSTSGKENDELGSLKQRFLIGKVLLGKGHVSHKQAIEKAEREFEIYRKREMDLLESDFDREVKRLKDSRK